MDSQNLNPPKFKAKIWPLVIIIVALTAASLAAVQLFYAVEKSQKDNSANLANSAAGKILGGVYQSVTAASSTSFAAYQEEAVKVTPQVPAYKVAANLSNITNLDQFNFSKSVKSLLVKNAFAVVPDFNKEFYPIYENNRYNQIPSFITSDSILHNYHLLLDMALKSVEEDKLIPELKNLNAAMLADSLSLYQELKGTAWENAAKRNVGFFAVGSSLLDSTTTVPEIVKIEVSQELALIDAHAGIAVSPVMNIGAAPEATINTPAGDLPLEALKEDYSQYVPRGHYDRSDALKAYFKSMMWYGRLTFRLKNDDETRSALLIALTLSKDANLKSWAKIYEPINFFVGKSDDITFYDYQNIMNKVYGPDIDLKTVVSDQDKFAAFTAAAQQLTPPQINSMPIFNVNLQPDRTKEITGFRFMGQRFTVDASIFQRLIVREVGPKDAKCADAPFADGRFLPKGLDIPAAFGSNEALNILKSAGETDYACYPENMDKMKIYMKGLDQGVWTQNLYWGWLYSLLTLTKDKPAGYPAFMENTAWTRKELNTFLGSWTELKHDTILYAKQVYAELGGGGEPTVRDHRGYVEPNPYLYARLAALAKMTSAGLSTRQILSSDLKSDLDLLQQISLNLKAISEKELNNQDLTKNDYDFIESYGGQIEHFWEQVFKDEPNLDEYAKSAAIVADVATDPNGKVLEEGDGYVSDIYAVVPIDGQLRLAKGGVYSYYEFSWNASDRLTDSKWRDLFDNQDTVPKLPDWAGAFTGQAGQ